jgi:hypothetical protein
MVMLSAGRRNPSRLASGALVDTVAKPMVSKARWTNGSG